MNSIMLSRITKRHSKRIIQTTLSSSVIIGKTLCEKGTSTCDDLQAKRIFKNRPCVQCMGSCMEICWLPK